MNLLVFLAGNAIRLAHAPRVRQKTRETRETRECSRSAQVEQRGKTILFMTSSAGQLHL